MTTDENVSRRVITTYNSNNSNNHWGVEVKRTRNITTIPVRPETKDRLKSLGLKGQTYDEIIFELVEHVKYEEFMERQYQRLKEKSKFVPFDAIE